jgi:hypothetical protein
MSIFEHSRFQIWSQIQHPLKHTLSDFGYSNPALAGVSTVEGVLNYLIAALYPNAKAAVANPAALPLVGNTINDYRVVQNDGDGKAAGYRWEQREGEASPSWHKILDADWSTDSILAAYLDITNEMYVVRRGRQDLDASGTIITGDLAGQTIFGGTQANQNLTLKANSGDGVGAPTGFVQIGDNFRPLTNNLFDLGTSAKKFKDVYLSNSALIGNITISSGSISDSGGSLSFGSNNLTTSGDIQGANITATTQLKVDLGAQEVVLTPTGIATTESAFGFGAANLSTTGTLDAQTLTLTQSGATFGFDPNNGGGKAAISASLGAITFGAINLDTTGTLGAGAATFTSVGVDNLSLNGSTLTTTSGALTLDATTNISVLKTMNTTDISATGTVGVTGLLTIDNLSLDGNTLASTDVNGNINLSPNGAGEVVLSSHLRASTDANKDLGNASQRFRDLFLSGGIKDGTDVMSVTRLMHFEHSGFRNITELTAAVNGDVLTWDSANSRWLAAAPSTASDHTALSNLTTGDAGHTQFAMLAGRSGGQDIIGGTGVGQHLTLESTSNVTKGYVKVKDDLVPFTNASYSGSWSGTDLGDTLNYFRDLYMKGEAKLHFWNIACKFGAKCWPFSVGYR